MRVARAALNLRRVTAPGITLQQLGWDDVWQRQASAYAEHGVPGRVARVDRGLCSVLTEAGVVRASYGGELLDTVAADPALAPCTGDWGVVRHWPDGPTTLEAVLSRHTSVTRATAVGTSVGQVLAANVDVVAVVAALHPEPNLARIERLLAMAWESGARPLVTLTKADLVGDADLVAEDVRRVAPGAAVVCCSTVTGAGIDVVRRAMGPQGTLALLGASGHGKSSLTNALVGAEVLTVRAIRADGKGRHTSVRRELLPLPGGGCVIDTPGLRGVGLHGVDSQRADSGLAATFPDVVRLAAACRFTDCTHQHEPGCAVQQAVESGELDVRRLESWVKLQREADWMATRSDARLRAAQHRKWKQLSKEHRTPRRARP